LNLACQLLNQTANVDGNRASGAHSASPPPTGAKRSTHANVVRKVQVKVAANTMRIDAAKFNPEDALDRPGGIAAQS